LSAPGFNRPIANTTSRRSRVGARERGIHLGLRLDLGSAPVTGELVPPDGPPMRFSGYAGLIAAVGQICETQAAGAAGHAPSDSTAGADR
jgi:hypothetical protein